MVQGARQAGLAAAGLLDDPVSAGCLAAERELVTALDAGCQAPLGAVAIEARGQIELRAVVISLDGEIALHKNGCEPLEQAAPLGRRIAGDLIADGAAELLARARRAPAAVEGIQP